MKNLKLVTLALALVSCYTHTALGPNTDIKNVYATDKSNAHYDQTKYDAHNTGGTYKAYDNTMTSTEPDFKTTKNWDYTTRTYNEKYGNKPMTEKNQVRRETNYPMQDTMMYKQNRTMN